MSRRCTRPVMKRSEDHCSRQIAYSRCREGILKKAAELSVFSNADIGLLMFFPTGRLTSFANKGRVLRCKPLDLSRQKYGAQGQHEVISAIVWDNLGLIISQRMMRKTEAGSSAS
ncbi:hypothetical protein GOBAR_DD34185 [Gossypium barbadense]|nr:hypothetical protein GOBAR_DD34185 [Gossypium barbadense]